ncbi:frataxin-like domain-containing protein [Ditylenchus destructor]|nr:frataxin-like domain-containing protein [Ditylenchus destructor]
MSLTEARFHDLVDSTQQALEDIFDDSGLDVDLENSAGVLTVKFENGTQLIFSRQEPLRQLWLAARSVVFTSITTKKTTIGSATPAMSCSVKCSRGWFWNKPAPSWILTRSDRDPACTCPPAETVVQ